MYKWMRNTHLLLGLFCFLFLLMYGVSSVQMAHNKWFVMKPRIVESRFALSKGASSARAVARELMDRHGLRGELMQVRETVAGFSFRFTRPGTVHEVSYSSESGAATVRTGVTGFLGMLNRIHHLGGMWHDYQFLNVWGAFLGLVSLALIAMALTGIYLWFKIHNQRAIGAILLSLSLGYSLTLMVLIRLA